MDVESDEGFIVTLNSPSGIGTITTATATGTIQNDDLSYAIVATEGVNSESDAATTPFTFTVTRSGLTSVTGTVDFEVTGSQVDGATADDFAGTFPPAQSALTSVMSARQSRSMSVMTWKWNRMKVLLSPSLRLVQVAVALRRFRPPRLSARSSMTILSWISVMLQLITRSRGSRTVLGTPKVHSF
ncbi:hypothetical protein RMSM_03535 [Rhodopirellula maiorica SM1]|uniref:Uncharacterized protein n=1 Tax=Rhodopirellula maiorica SM1 TaxID=1265738 RepID=M5RK11_9BACT|nr:hypothetical protein RMSM_03535 [Rhodopirellula maiorica SM1]